MDACCSSLLGHPHEPRLFNTLFDFFVDSFSINSRPGILKSILLYHHERPQQYRQRQPM